MKILAVDDDTVSLELLRECLTEGGYDQINLETSPLKALDALAAASPCYDCILLDIDMPEMDGISLCAEIRKSGQYKNTPILMITRYKNRASVQKAFEKGATDYITKPFEFLEVLTRVRVAERLVKERQAAIDSYMALQNMEMGRQKTAPAPEHRRSDAAIDIKDIETADDPVLSPVVFQNYLEQVTKSSTCDLNLVAIQIQRIDRIFQRTSAADFTAMMQAVGHAIANHFRPHSVFVSQAGNGVFLATMDGSVTFNPQDAEAGIARMVNSMNIPKGASSDTRLDLIVGVPLNLPTSPKLNFRRAVKAAIARMKQREQEQGDFGLSSLAS